MWANIMQVQENMSEYCPWRPTCVQFLIYLSFEMDPEWKGAELG